MKKKHFDPFFDREKEKYAHPIPSREYILQILSEFGRPMGRNQLLNALKLDNTEDQEALGFRLKAMLRDGQIMQDRKGRYCLLNRLNLIRGKIHAHPDGYGFLIPEQEGDDLVLSPSEMRKVMHGDLVLAYPVGLDKRGRMEAKIHEIIEHANKNVVGQLFIQQGIGIVTPNNRRLTQDITILPDELHDAKDGQIVLVDMLTYPSSRQQALGKIVHVLGDHMAPGMEIDIAIHAYHLPIDWPEDALNEVGKIPLKVSEQEIKGRKDLRHLPFVTIDGEDAKDFDDAVFCERLPNQDLRLFVAIADVSHYVQPNSPLDQEAARRGNSVYFPGRVIPMLPEALSNGICSLNPQVDRLCMVAELVISPQGKTKRTKIYRGVFHSQARLTYTQVDTWLKQAAPDAGYEAIWPHIRVLADLYGYLSEARKKRGALDFDTIETQIIFDDQRKIEKIRPLIRNDAHRLIEECMLAANVAVAEFLAQKNLPILYRVHPPPEEEKITALREFLSEIGLRLAGGKNPKPKDFQKTLNDLIGRPEKKLIDMIMLRTLKQAQYVEKNDGHFGLAYHAYTHFTSPIRRYPDLLVHRALAHAMDESEATPYPYSHQDIAKIARHCSQTERLADEATRDAVAWLKCEYMQSKLGQVFTGSISNVTAFGIFVELEDIFVEGLVHITSLKSDYYHYDPTKHRLIGERSGRIYRLGEKMTVMVAGVSLDDKKIDFEPVETSSGEKDE